MLSPAAFNWLVDALTRRGYPAAVAVDYAVRIGDTPELDQAGQIVVRDDAGQIIERIPGSLLQTSPP